MSKFMLLILTFTLVDAMTFAEKLRWYSSGHNATLYGVEKGALMYLASNDDIKDLMRIKITSGNSSIRLGEMNLDNEASPKSFLLPAGLTIESSNSYEVSRRLTGYIYVTTKEQANDPTFSVQVIKEKHNVFAPGPQSTVVILNTALNTSIKSSDTPKMNSYIAEIAQAPDTNLTLHWGLPDGTIKNRFFRNPIYYETEDNDGNYYNTSKFFDNVDTLQVPLDYWYFTVDGPVVMKISNAYEVNYNYTTKYVNTTGLVSTQDYFHSHEVNFHFDSSRLRTVGTLISSFLYDNQTARITFSKNNGRTGYSQRLDSKEVLERQSIIDFEATQFLVESSSTRPGSFFCQYFGFSGDLLPTTTTTTTTRTTTTPTTRTTTTATSTTPPVTSTSTTQTPIGSSSTTEGPNPTSSSISTVTPSSSPSTTPITTIETTTKSIESPSILSSILIIIFSFFVLF